MAIPIFSDEICSKVEGLVTLDPLLSKLTPGALTALPAIEAGRVQSEPEILNKSFIAE